MFLELLTQATLGYFGSTVGYTPNPEDPDPNPWPWWRGFLTKLVVAGIGGIVGAKFLGAGMGAESMFASGLMSMAAGKIFGDLGRGVGVNR